MVDKDIIDKGLPILVSGKMKYTSKDRVQRTVTLPEKLDRELRVEAARRDMPISHLAEKAIASYLEKTADVA